MRYHPVTKTLVLLTFLCILPGAVKSQDYDVSKIPENLKENALAVVRKYHYDVEVLSLNKLSYEQVYAITIFDKKGEDLIRFLDYFDSSDKYRSLEANCYNDKGKRLQRFNSRDFEEYSAVRGFELFSDARIKTLNPLGNNYPYTIEYIVKKEDKDFLSMPVFFPVRKENVSIESMQYNLTIPADYRVNIREYNVPKAVENSGGDKKTYSWKISGFEALEIEPYSPGVENYLPKVLIIPEEFEYGGFTGSFRSWKEFGLWHKKLNEGMDVLPEECVARVHSLTEGMTDEVEKVKILYEYLQKNTRYVGVSYGIGGYRPIPAGEVYKYGYGDCKALSNYMKALLKEAGVEAYYTKVYGGSRPSAVDTTLPSQQFNHIILCVPVKKDTLWLECTSQTNPFNYIAGFTDDRYVLLVKETGGELVRTKAYPLQNNLQSRKAQVVLKDGNSTLSAHVKTTFKGWQYRRVGNLALQTEEKQKEYLLKNIDIAQFKLGSFDMTREMPLNEPVASLELDLSLPHYYSTSGDRILLPLNLMNKWSYVPPKIKDRKTDVYISRSWIDTDTIEYILPENTDLQYIPEDVNMEYPFGEYKSSIKVGGNKLIYSRCMKMKEGNYPKESYADLVNFFFEVAKADGSKAMLGMKP